MRTTVLSLIAFSILAASTGTASSQTLSDRDKAALAAYKTLGPVPGGAKIENHSIVRNVNDFRCPDGSKGVVIKEGKSEHYTHRRYGCPRGATARLK